MAEKNWEGCGGLTVTDEMRVTIAAQACLLVLGFDDQLLRCRAVDSDLSPRVRGRPTPAGWAAAKPWRPTFGWAKPGIAVR